MDRGTKDRGTNHLRVLIANERKDRFALVAPIVVALGHEVIAREIDTEDVAQSSAGNARTSRSSGSERAPSTRCVSTRWCAKPPAQ
jgi:hypothetical protein